MPVLYLERIAATLFEHPAAELSVDDSAQLCEDRRQADHIASLTTWLKARVPAVRYGRLSITMPFLAGTDPVDLAAFTVHVLIRDPEVRRSGVGVSSILLGS